jgi:hypothetical protein
MAMKVSDANNVLEEQAKSWNVAAESIKEQTLGQIVAAVIEVHGEVSVALLRAWLEKAISQSASDKEEKSSEPNLARLGNEAALNYLNDLLAKSHAHNCTHRNRPL